MRNLWSFIMRHKFRFIDLIAVGVGALGLLWTALHFNIFSDTGLSSQTAEQLELDELLLVVGALAAGLMWALRRLLRERRETARRAETEQQMRVLAFQDALTGLPNRRQFDDRLKAALATSPRAGGVHAVLMMDLNGFKRVNDVFGHAVGDEVLMHVGARLSRIVRQGDLLARLGGDEFVILAPNLSGPEAATGLAMRAIEVLEQPVSAGAQLHAVGVGIGIAVCPQDAHEPAELLRKADIALYRAKRQATSALRFFEDEMDAHVRERDHLERALRAAIEAEAIDVVYQPQIDMKSGDVVEFEALARWTDPVLGDVEPERFIPVAEDTGLVGKMTDTMLERACRDACGWPAHVMLAFNISPVLLGDPGLALRVVAILGRTGLAPNRLELEITESALVRDLEAARLALGTLREAGVRIALDDFGTGCSSLYHLQSFKLDKIKIDRSFVARMAEEDESGKIVRALIGLGTGLGLAVTAEGVETNTQRRLLSDHGCEQAQGFLYSPAVAAAETHRLIENAVRQRPSLARGA